MSSNPGSCSLERFPSDEAQLRKLSDALETYRPARQQMLTTLGLGVSNRDPLAEWSEHFVAALTGGILAESRVQSAFDLITPDGLRVQVRYLANPGRNWANEHVVQMPVGADRYALVIFEAFEVIGVVMFPPHLTLICEALGKRHGNQDIRLLLTRRNWWAIRDDRIRFRELGVHVWLPPFGKR
jgi:hypothetical protein